MNDRLEISSKIIQGVMSNNQTKKIWPHPEQMALAHADALIALEAKTRKVDFETIIYPAFRHY